MVKCVVKGSLEDELYKYLIVKDDKNLNVTYKLKEDAPQKIKDYFSVWKIEQEELNKLKNIKVE